MRALNWLIPGMCENMAIQMSGMCALVVALFAGIAEQSFELSYLTSIANIPFLASVYSLKNK